MSVDALIIESKRDPHGGLCLDPPERIEFKQHLTSDRVKLIIKNPTQKRIAFEINSTKPKRYRIIPSRSILYPGQSEKVEVTLRPQQQQQLGGGEEEEEAANFNKTDRFEVKYFYYDEHDKGQTDTDTIYFNEPEKDQRIELDSLNVLSLVVSILLIAILVYFLLNSISLPNIVGDLSQYI
jgi:hypothetical protein